MSDPVFNFPKGLLPAEEPTTLRYAQTSLTQLTGLGDVVSGRNNAAISFEALYGWSVLRPQSMGKLKG